ncbi:MAG: TlpA family protein disulfide reductase [Bacteroidota bacterium]
MKKMIPLLILFVIGAYLFYKFGPKPGIKENAQAPAIQSKLIDGSAFQLDDLNGNYVILDFWASWCGPCHREAGDVLALYNKYEGKTFKDGNGFELLSVALERNDRNWKAVAEKLGFNWKYQIVDISRIVATSDIASPYGVNEIPAKFLIGPSGEFLLVKASLQEIDAYLSELE